MTVSEIALLTISQYLSEKKYNNIAFSIFFANKSINLHLFWVNINK